jgi:trimeric autotransporter adhesin
MGSRIRRIGAIMIGFAVPCVALTGASASLPPHSVGTAQLRNGAVTTSKLRFQAVRTQRLAPGAVTNGKLSSAAVSRGKLQREAVNSAKVERGSLKGSDIDQLTLDFGILQHRLTAPCPPGNAIRAVDRDGHVTCQEAGSPDAWELSGNAGTDPPQDFLGTTDNTPLNLRVNDARALRLEPAVTSPNLIGGQADNSVTDGAQGATISGGGDGDASNPNQVTDDFGTVGGGDDNRSGDGAGTTSDRPNATVGGGAANTASGVAATVGGGEANTASGGDALVAGGSSNKATALNATVGGGLGNLAILRNATVAGGTGNSVNGNAATIGGGAANSASGAQGTVAGGELNFANAELSALGGGFSNQAGGRLATVPGGEFNHADGDFSFAAGRHALAKDNGAFVWADSTDADIASTASDQFIARAGGDFFLTSNSTLPEDQGLINTSAGANPDGTNGAYLSSGGVWTDVSNQNAKRAFRAVRPTEVLRRVARLPVTSWSYKAEPGVRHLGPVAQDFHRAFGLGADGRHIAPLDTGGVTLAAIKALNTRLDRQSRQIARLKARLAGGSRGR